MNFSLQLGGWRMDFGKSAPAQESKSVGTSANAWLTGREGESTGTTLQNAYLQSTWVYACVSKLGRMVAGIPFRLLTGSDSDEDVIEQGPAVDLFSMPNPLLNRFQFWFLVVTWQQLRGEAFIIALDNGGNVVDVTRGGSRIEKLCLLNPGMVQHIVTGNKLQGWRYATSPLDSVPALDLLPEEVIHLPLPNPFDAWRGLSPLAVARLAAQTDYNAASFMQGLMGNNADTGLIVTTEQQPAPEQREAILAALRSRRSKSGSVPPPLFLWGGSKVEQPVISNVDMQFLENRKYSRQEICAIYDVPQELLGFSEDANRSVSDAARLSFMENRIAPYCAELEAGVAPIVRSVEPGARGEFHVKGTPIMQAAQRARIDTAVKAFGMGFTRNECNTQFDLGMPNDPTGDKRYLPFSLQEVGAKDEKPDGREDDVPEPGEQIRMGVERGLKSLALAPAHPHHECKADPRFEAATEGAVRRKRAALRNFFTEQQARVLARLEAPSQTKAEGDPRPVEDIFDILEETAKLAAKLKPLLRGDISFGGQQVFEELNLEIDFDIAPVKADEFLARRRNEIQNINRTTFEQLRKELREGIDQGDTMVELKDRVKSVYRDASDARAEVIAKTETNIAINTGRHEGMKEAGVERKGWQTSRLENTRQTHLANESKSEAENGIPIDDEWPNGLLYPGDPNGEAGEVINCRCFGFAIVDTKSARPGRILTYEEFVGRRRTHPDDRTP